MVGPPTRSQPNRQSDRVQPGTALRHIPALDGLRGAAVAAVLLYHGNALPGGFLGVDLFFVLSGFLITSLLIAEVGRSGRLRLGAFWARRARRLLPALFVMLVGVAAYAALLASPAELNRIRGDAFGTLFYFANWHSIAAGHGYWALFQSPSPLEHTWSLAIEEQFYLAWPLVVFGLTWLAVRTRRQRERRIAVQVLAVSLVGATASTVLMWLLYQGSDSSRAYYGTDTRAASILFGAALAAWVGWRGHLGRGRARVALEAVGIGAAGVLGYAWATADGQSATLYRGGFLVCGLAAAAVIAAAAHPSVGPMARVLSFWPLRALGVISYGVYLWHWPVYVAMTPSRTGLGGDTLLAARIAATIAVAMVSFVVVERPIRTTWRPARRVQLLLVPAAASACVVALLVATAGGSPSTGSTLADGGLGPGIGHGETRGVVTAAPTPKAAGPRVLIIGDSVGGDIGLAGQALQQEVGYPVQGAAVAGCLLASGIDARGIDAQGQTTPLARGTPCEPIWLAGQRAVSPTNVVVVYGSAAAFQELSLAGQWYGACDRPYQLWYELQMRAKLEEFLSQGATVHLVTIPHMSSDWTPPDANARIDCIDEVHARIVASLPHVSLVDLADFVCPHNQCRQDFGGAPFRPDGLHYSGPGSLYVTRWILQTIQAGAPVASPPTTGGAPPPRAG